MQLNIILQKYRNVYVNAYNKFQAIIMLYF